MSVGLYLVGGFRWSNRVRGQVIVVQFPSLSGFVLITGSMGIVLEVGSRHCSLDISRRMLEDTVGQNAVLLMRARHLGEEAL
jgi:hypothetical protein